MPTEAPMRAPAERAWIALGSNLGDRAEHLRGALLALEATPGLRLAAVSRVYETEPVGPPQGPYLNAVVELECRLEALALLDVLQAIERRRGRVRDPDEPRYGPRTLDLDILLLGERRVEVPGLRIPHPRLHERAFVLEPLADLVPDLAHPVLGRSVADLAAGVRDEVAVRLWPDAAQLRIGGRGDGSAPMESKGGSRREPGPESDS